MMGLVRRSFQLCMSNSIPSNHVAATMHVRYKKKKAKPKPAKTVEVSQESAGLINLKKYEESMRDTLDALKNSLARFRTGLPNPALLDDIPVEVYGSRTTLKTVAQVAVRDGRNIFVTTFDESLVGAVEKAVRGAGMSLNPVPEGNGRLRVPVPKPSNESRRNMSELVQQEAEGAKVATRLVRRKAMDEIKSLKDDISKDDVKRFEKNVQVMTNRWIDRITQMQQIKVKTILDSSMSVRK